MQRFWVFTGLFLCMSAIAAWGQVGHPAKGSWSGYWESSDEQRTRALVLLDWVNNEITGTMNPGRNSAPISDATLDVSTWTLTIEADMPLPDGSIGRFIASGRLENLGSWTNRRYSGTYRHGNEEGTFILVLN